MSDPAQGSKYSAQAEPVQIVEQTDGREIVAHQRAPAPALLEAAKEIEQLLKQLAHNNPKATEAELVEQAIQHNPNLKERLVRALQCGGIEAVKTLIPGIGIPIEMIQGILETEDARVPEKVSQGLERLTHPDPSYRAEAAQILGIIGDETAIPALVKVVSDDPNPEVRGSAIRALGKLGSTLSSS